MNTIVIGCPATDLIATGFERFPGTGELINGKELRLGAGGKTRNIAEMIARLSPSSQVAMVGRTVRDPYGLWKPPIDALKEAGVNTEYMVITDYEETQKLPCITFIPVDKLGNNKIYVLPGVSTDFCPADIEKAAPLFESIGSADGSVVLTIGHTLDTLECAVKLANRYGLKVMLDPGGVQDGMDIENLMHGAYLIKPNVHEAEILTGISVTDLQTATQAASKLRSKAIENIVITAGALGAFVLTNSVEKHIPIPQLNDLGEKDESGCGDQVMAALCAFMDDEISFERAAEIAVTAGTLQFHKSGIQPITRMELFERLQPI